MKGLTLTEILVKRGTFPYFRMSAPERALWLMKIKGGGSAAIIKTITGEAPLVLEDAVSHGIVSLTQTGKCVQSSTPTPDAPVDIVCNNGVLRMVDDELPAGHTRLQYIESDGTSESGGFVDTGIVLNTIDLDVEVDFQFTDTTSSSPKMAWGYMASGNLPRWGFGIYSSKWLGSPNVTVSAGSIDTNRHTAVLSVYEDDGEKYSGTIDGDALYSETTLGNVAVFKNNTLPVYLFTRNNNGVAGNFAPLRISGFRVRKGGVLTNDLVPDRNENGVLGYYDLKTSTFHAGSGTLTAGPVDYSHAHVGVVGTPEVLTVGGKNLFDVASVGIEQGAITSSTGTNSNSNYRVRTVGYVPVKPSTQYTLSVVIDGYTAGQSRGVFILEYTTDDVSGYAGDTSGWQVPEGYAFTTGATTNFIRIVFAAGSNSNTPVAPSDISNAQLEYGSTVTTYEPYRTPQTASVVNLLAVGDYADSQELIAGPVNRKIGAYVFTGNEAFLDGNNGYITEAVQDQSNLSFTPLCTHFKGTNGTPAANSNTVRVYRTSGGVGRMYFGVDKTVYPTKEAFAASLAGVIILYLLAEEVTEQVAGQHLSTSAGDNVVSVVSNVDPVTLEVKYKAKAEAA